MTRDTRATLAARLLAVLFTAVVSGSGLFSAFTRYHHGRTARFGGAAIELQGAPSVRFGLGLFVLGLLPLALWARGRRTRGVWAACCLVTGLAIMLWRG